VPPLAESSKKLFKVANRRCNHSTTTRMAHVIHAAVDAITGSSWANGAADDYHACLYVIKKECATKDFDEVNDLGLPAEVCLPVASPLWHRLAGSLAQVKHAAHAQLHAKATASDTASFLARVSPRSNPNAAAHDPTTQLATFLVSQGDTLFFALGEPTAAQLLCYDPAARLMRGGIASIDDLSPTGYGQSVDALTLALKTSSDAGHRAKLILHARAVFGAALSFAKQVSNVGNKVGGTGRPGSSDPQLRYELTLRNLIARLDEVRVAMRLLVMEQERCLLIKKEIREGKKESEGRVVVGAASSLYWLLQNGTIAIFALADPMIVAGEFGGGRVVVVFGCGVVWFVVWFVVLFGFCCLVADCVLSSSSSFQAKAVPSVLIWRGPCWWWRRAWNCARPNTSPGESRCTKLCARATSRRGIGKVVAWWRPKRKKQCCN
jgi:hypothetical protein